MNERINLTQLEATLNETPQTTGQSQTHDAVRTRPSPIRPQNGNGNGADSRSTTSRLQVAQEAIPQARTGTSVEAILAERATTHGDFTDNARVMQSLKRVIWQEAGWSRLTDPQREGLEMVLHKIGRIISGNANVKDHWDDIAGYAKLCSDRIIES